MAGGRSISFEVYYLQYGRWQIHHRYGLAERETAIDEAKRLDTQGHFDAACVIRESYDNATGVASETVIYHSPKMKTKPPVALITAGQDGAGGGKAGAARSVLKNAPRGSAAANAAAQSKQRAKGQQENARPRKAEPELRRPPMSGDKRSSGDWMVVLRKLSLAFVLACVAGTAAGMVAFQGMKGLATLGIAFGPKVGQGLLIGAWFIGWVCVFVPMLRRILVRAGRNARSRADKEPPQATPPPSPSPSPVPSPTVEADTVARTLQSEADRLKALEEPASDDAADSAESEQRQPPVMLEPEIETVIDPEPVEEVMDDVEDDPPVPVTKTDMPTGPAPLRAALSELVAEAKALSDTSLDKDHFARFGVILFLAGAAETLARRFRVAAKEVRAILSEQIQAMGASAQMALGFAANIDEYLLDKRYFDMYSLGRSSALNRGADPKAASGFDAALKMWKTPKPPPGQDDPKHYDVTPSDQQAYGFVAVLFTDIVGSTRSQQQKGDEWLMNVVRAHNDIVRQAITKYHGREIKHTGDGIMASFPAVISSVEAALTMQEGIAKFSELMPDLAFEISIGISAGEPIHESGDLFGTPVNMAARVLSKASASQTAVSSIVRDLCQGKNFVFDELGRFELKGFDEPQPIYRVVERRRTPRG